MPSLGPMEIAVVAIVALIVFGPQRLPEMMRTVGKTLAELRRQAQDIRTEFESGLDEMDPRKPSPPDVIPPADVTPPADITPPADVTPPPALQAPAEEESPDP